MTRMAGSEFEIRDTLDDAVSRWEPAHRYSLKISKCVIRR